MLRLEAHAIVLADGSVSIMHTLPTAARYEDAEIAVTHCRQDAVILANGLVLPLDDAGDAPEEWTLVYADAPKCIGKWHPDAQARVVSHTPIDRAIIPADETFRNAWRFDGATFSVDMGHARELHRDRMREARAPLLGALDVAYDKADERGDATGKADVAARKQALRDVTADPAIAAAGTPDELKAVWPDCLVNQV